MIRLPAIIILAAASLGLSAQNDPAAVKVLELSLIHISEHTRLLSIPYAVFCLKKKKNYTYRCTTITLA